MGYKYNISSARIWIKAFKFKNELANSGANLNVTLNSSSIFVYNSNTQGMQQSNNNIFWLTETKQRLLML